MPYKLKILSPLHIGCGEEYSGLNFIIDDRKFYYIEPDSLFKYLGNSKMQHFIRWIEENTKKIDALEKEQKTYKSQKKEKEFKETKQALRKTKRNFTLLEYIRSTGLNTRSLLDEAVYSSDIMDKIYNDIEINPFIKQMNHPYIPGSEIKGAIRTAVLYYQLTANSNILDFLKSKFQKYQRDNADEIASVRNSSKPDTKVKKKLAERMEKVETALQEEILNSVKGDAKYDVMKYLTVGDSALLNANAALAVSSIEPFNISRSFRLYNEFIVPDSIVSLTSLTLEADRSKKIKLDKLAFSNRQKNIVASMTSLLDCCFRFSNDLIQEEIDFFNRHGKNNIVTHLEGIKAANQKTSPVLRIGKDEGFNSLTVGMAVKKLEPDLYKNVLIHTTKGKSYDSEFPKTRKIVHWNGKELTAGWVKLMYVTDKETISTATAISIKEKTLPKPDLSGLKEKFGKGSLRK